MTRYGVVAILAFGMAISANAQNSSQNSSVQQPGAAAQANASAGASANVSSQNQNTSPNQRASRSTSVSGASGASASASAGNQSIDLANGSRLNATLLTTLDAKHCKPGERVVAKTTQNVKQNGRVVVKKGTRLVGHVTEASARSKNHAESTLGVVFDRAILHNGEEVPLHLSIQALAESATAASANLGDDEAGLGSAGDAGFAGGGGAAVPAGGLVRGAGGLAGGAANSAGAFAQHTDAMANSAAGATSRSATSAVAGARGATGGLNAEGALESNSSGVFGLNGLALNSAASSASDASVITSSTRNVHLASGTQMVLQVVR